MAQNYEPWPILAKAKPLVDDPFTLYLDNFTCYQLIGKKNFVEPSRTVLLVIFSLVLPLSPFLVCCSCHIVLFFIFKKYN